MTNDLADTARAPRVSVIMPSYNHGVFVGEAIDSVLAQSFADFEFVITDDGSTDDTVEIIRNYTDPRISLEVLAANQGACEAANRCIARSRGEYIAVISSDDYFLPDKLARQVAILDARPELAAVFGLVEFVDDRGGAVPSDQNRLADAFSTAPANRFAWLRRFFLQGNALCHSTAMVRRPVYEEVGYYDVAFRQLPDMDMWVRICARYPILVLPEVLTGFRVLSGLRNVSAASPSQVRRSVWEHSRVLRRYWSMDEATLERAFGADIPQHVAERGLPMAVQLAIMAGTTDLRRYAPEALQLYALETLEDAIARGVPNVGPKDLHQLTGDLDPFRFSAFAESLAERERLEEQIAAAASERDQASVAIAELRALLQSSAADAEEANARGLQLEANLAQAAETLRRTGPVVLSLSEAHARATDTIAGLQLTSRQADATIDRLRAELSLLADVLGSREQQIAALDAALQALVNRSLVRRARAASERYATKLAALTRRFSSRATRVARRVSKRYTRME